MSFSSGYYRRNPRAGADSGHRGPGSKHEAREMRARSLGNVGLGIMGVADGVEAHCQLLVDPFPVRVGHNMGWVAVHPGKPSDIDRDAGLLGDFADRCCRADSPTSSRPPGSFQYPSSARRTSSTRPRSLRTTA